MSFGTNSTIVRSGLLSRCAASWDFWTNPRPAKSMSEFDFVVIGSGVAGLSLSLKLAEHGSVAIVTKRQADRLKHRLGARRCRLRHQR